MSLRRQVAGHLLRALRAWRGRQTARRLLRVTAVLGPVRHLIALVVFGVVVVHVIVTAFVPLPPLVGRAVTGVFAAGATQGALVTACLYLYYPRGPVRPASLPSTGLGNFRWLVGLAMVVAAAIVLTLMARDGGGCPAGPAGGQDAGSVSDTVVAADEASSGPGLTEIPAPTETPAPTATPTPSPTPLPPFVPGSLGSCEFESPSDHTHVFHYVKANVDCSPGTSMKHVYVLVHPPQFEGEPRLWIAVYRLHKTDDMEYFVEVVIGTDLESDDFWTFTACITRLTPHGAAQVEKYYESRDRSGIPNKPQALEDMDCLPLVHDPEVTPLLPDHQTAPSSEPEKG